MIVLGPEVDMSLLDTPSWHGGTFPDVELQLRFGKVIGERIHVNLYSTEFSFVYGVDGVWHLYQASYGKSAYSRTTLMWGREAMERFEGDDPNGRDW